MTVGEGQFDTNSINVDDTSVYWANGGAGSYGSIVKAPLAGGVPTTLAAGREAPASLVRSGTTLYWIEKESTIEQMKAAGGAVSTFLSTYAFMIGVDEYNLYWSVNGGVDGTVMESPLAGGPPIALARHQRSPAYLAVGGSDVFWSAFSGLFEVTKAGGKINTIVPWVEVFPVSCLLAVDVANAYCLDWQLAAVVKYPVAGGSATTLAGPVDGGSSTLGAITTDGASVYWVTESALMKVPAGGGAVVTLAPIGGSAVAVNATAVYWATGTKFGEILMISPK